MVKLCVMGLPLQKFDPFALPSQEAPITKSAMNVRLNGTNYVSEKTRQEFENAMNDGFQVNNEMSSSSNSGSAHESTTSPNPGSSASGTSGLPAAVGSEEAVDAALKLKSEPGKQSPAIISTMSRQQTYSQQSNAPDQAMETMEKGLSGFYQHQNETLQVHRQYLDQQAEYARTVYQLMQQRIELASQGAAYPPEVDQQMQMFHTHQSETLRVHEQYLNQQSEQTQSALKITELQLGGPGQQLSAAPAVSAPIPAPIPAAISTQVQPVPLPAATAAVPVPAATSAVSTEEVTVAMMAIVSEKTGYPQEMLEHGMDMESDLVLIQSSVLKFLVQCKKQFQC